MNPVHQQFLALLRGGLWGNPVDPALFSGVTDWNGILTLAMQQTVPLILTDPINRLPKNLHPPVLIMRHLHNLAVRNIRRHAQMNHTLVEAVTLFRRHGMQPILLKGQGVASNYPDPTQRWCGDIDLYMGGYYMKACALADQWGECDRQASESRKHYHFRHDGVVVELHRIAEQLPAVWHNIRFQRWTKAHLQGDGLRETELGGAMISLPPVNFDALYIFNHLWHHFSSGDGVGFRQLCDWVRYLHTFHLEIDCSRLKRDLRAFGLWHPWRIFGYIAVDVLGLPACEFPFYSECCVKQGEVILQMVLTGGNFGFFGSSNIARPEGYLRGKLHSLFKKHKRIAVLFPLFPKQMAGVWLCFLYYGVKQVLVDKTIQVDTPYIKHKTRN